MAAICSPPLPITVKNYTKLKQFCKFPDPSSILLLQQRLTKYCHSPTHSCNHSGFSLNNMVSYLPRLLTILSSICSILQSDLTLYCHNSSDQMQHLRTSRHPPLHTGECPQLVLHVLVFNFKLTTVNK